MRPVTWSAADVRDVRRVHDDIEQFNPGAAKRIAAEIFSSTDILRRVPELGRRGADDTREQVVLGRSVIVYRTSPDNTRILRVCHGAEDRPGSRPPPRPA